MDDPPVPCAGHGSQGVPQDLGPQHHAGAAAEGGVVHMPEGVPGEGAEAVGGQFMPQLPEGPTGDAQAGGLEELREEGEGIEAHQPTRAWRAFR